MRARGSVGLSFTNFATAVSGGLSDELRVEEPESPSKKTQQEDLKIRQQRKAVIAENKATMERKMKIVMENPHLWNQFKHRLAQTDHRGSKLGVQKALQEFIEENEDEIFAEERIKEKEQKKPNRRSARMSILNTVQNLTADLAGESAGGGRGKRSASMGFGSATSHATATGHHRSASMGMAPVGNLAPPQHVRSSSAGVPTSLGSLPSPSNLRSSTAGMAVSSLAQHLRNSSLAGNGAALSAEVALLHAQEAPITPRRLRNAHSNVMESCVEEGEDESTDEEK